MITVSEDQPPSMTPDTPGDPHADLSPADAGLADGTRLSETIVGHLTDQARRTADAAKARRVVNADGEPGVLDLAPLRELLSELVAELGKLRLRDRIANALRQAADIIESQPPGR